MLTPEVLKEALANIERVAKPDGYMDGPPYWFAKLRGHIDAMEERAKSAENMLLSFTPSGSEYFIRHGDGFRVDIYECERVIREDRESGIRAKIERARLRNGLPAAQQEK